MPTLWTNEIWRLLAVVIVGILAGAPFGYPWLGTSIALVAYLVWYLRQLSVIEQWVVAGSSRRGMPDVGGALGHFVYLIYRLQKRYRERKQRLAGMLGQFNASASALPDAAIVLGEHGQIEWVNRAANELLGISNHRDLGLRINALIRAPSFQEYMRTAEYGQPLELVSPVDEQRMLSLRVIAYGDNKRLLIARDISEQARIRQMRKDFVANVSHELRTPLTVITGYLETLDNDPAISSEVAARLQTVSQQVQRMNRLVDELLSLSRLEAKTLQVTTEQDVVPVATMLAGLVDDARKLSDDREHQLYLRADTHLALQGRESELMSAFANLINNAVLHTPAGTRVEIRWYQGKDGAYLEVEDFGPGIEAKHIARLTERFYRVDSSRNRERGGTGLGLAIVKHVLQRHEADLSINSELGQGSLFRCHFPVSRLLNNANVHDINLKRAKSL